MISVGRVDGMLDSQAVSILMHLLTTRTCEWFWLLLLVWVLSNHLHRLSRLHVREMLSHRGGHHVRSRSRRHRGSTHRRSLVELGESGTATWQPCPALHDNHGVALVQAVRLRVRLITYNLWTRRGDWGVPLCRRRGGHTVVGRWNAPLLRRSSGGMHG